MQANQCMFWPYLVLLVSFSLSVIMLFSPALHLLTDACALLRAIKGSSLTIDKATISYRVHQVRLLMQADYNCLKIFNVNMNITVCNIVFHLSRPVLMFCENDDITLFYVSVVGLLFVCLLSLLFRDNTHIKFVTLNSSSVLSRRITAFIKLVLDSVWVLDTTVSYPADVIQLIMVQYGKKTDSDIWYGNETYFTCLMLHQLTLKTSPFRQYPRGRFGMQAFHKSYWYIEHALQSTWVNTQQYMF